MSTGVLKTLIPGNWCICKDSQNTALSETTYIYSCTKTRVLVLTVEFCDWVCERVCRCKVSSSLTYFTDGIM